ncbi:CHAD domain-containing protein [Novosphingobium sp. YJ-S2-02]|uniref:CHAD domain-containing protein n=1 Tax=Novosphingobium aureum TaxID=2792964 RepID=A0A931H971_9SPHN|nr:CHAD domain-containing protein [Novosphingobium aureum]MBH0111660.1 CHAD domain-containing protein [Novosphingobium aureum]
MSYRFSQQDACVERALRRIATEQVDVALGAIAQGRADPALADHAVHEVRKSCKKVRALLRLGQPALADYGDADACFAGLARGLSGSRDARVVMASFERLTARLKGGGPDLELSALCQSLKAGVGLPYPSSAEGGAGPPQVLHALDEAAGRLEAARDQIAGWNLSLTGWEALGPGLAKTLAKATRARDALVRKPGARARHDLRKHLKYNWYHTRLLAPLWPGPFRARAASLAQVTEDLGEHHDLFVLCGHVRDAASKGKRGCREAADYVLRRAARRQRKLERRVDPEIARLLVRKPVGLARDWGRLWSIAMDR